MSDTPARPTDEEIAELQRLCDEATPWSIDTPNARLVHAAREWLPRLLALVTQEGGDANPPPARGEDKSLPARSSDAPERATGTFKGDLQSFKSFALLPDNSSPVPLPEGMETTREQHDVWAGFTGDQYNWQTITALVRDLRRALAEIARLTAALAEAQEERDTAQTEMVDYRADWEQQAREEEREACAITAAAWLEKQQPYGTDTRRASIGIAAAIRARSTP